MAANVASLAPFADRRRRPTTRSAVAPPSGPIVLLRKRAGADEAAAGHRAGTRVARRDAAVHAASIPALPRGGGSARRAPPGSTSAQDLVLVMTSANPGGEPLVIDNDEAVRGSPGIADAFLVHDRAIVTRCDDSVLRTSGAAATAQFVRRARGYTPRAIKLARPGPSVVALGGYFKNTVCVTRGDEAFVSQHIGDLDNAADLRGARRSGRAPDGDPRGRARDRSRTTCIPTSSARGTPRGSRERYRRAARSACSTIMPTSRRSSPSIASTAPVLGLALDGVGLGLDGSAWGGELLRVDGAAISRASAICAPLRLPGGDVAAREPWRMAAAALARCGRLDEIARRYARRARRGDRRADARARSQRARHVEHGPLFRRCGRSARRSPAHGVRRTGRDAAGRVGGERTAPVDADARGTPSVEGNTLDLSAAARAARRRASTPSFGARAVPRDARRGACRLGRARGARRQASRSWRAAAAAS